MSGGLFTNMLLRETGLDLNQQRIERLQRLHATAYRRNSSDVRPLPGARELLAALTSGGIPWAIATSGRLETAEPVLETLGIDLSRAVVVTRDLVKYAKPEPDLFLAAAGRLGVDIETASVVGDSVWDMLAATRARALGIGLLSGGTGWRSSSARARTAFSRIRPISWNTSMKSVDAGSVEPGAHG